MKIPHHDGDDASDDGTWERVCERVGRYSGPHRLITVRQGANVGAAKNFYGALERTDAEFLVLAHGDDISQPHRVQRLAETWLDTGASLIASQVMTGPDPDRSKPLAPQSDPSGPISLGQLCQVSWSPRQLGASFAFERRVLTEFGPFDRSRLPRGGDHVLPTRAALLGGFHYLSEPLLFWRRHPGQMTLQTADFSGGEHSHGETWRAYDLNGLLYRYDEIEGFEARHGTTPHLEEAKRILLATIAEHTGFWAEHRSCVEAEGATLQFQARGNVVVENQSPRANA